MTDSELLELAAKAANWERVKELEQMLKRFINADSFRVDASVPYPDAPFGDTTERLMAARKLLEEGNE